MFVFIAATIGHIPIETTPVDLDCEYDRLFQHDTAPTMQEDA